MILNICQRAQLDHIVLIFCVQMRNEIGTILHEAMKSKSRTDAKNVLAEAGKQEKRNCFFHDRGKCSYEITLENKDGNLQH